MADEWVGNSRTGDVAWDNQAKEYVLITNGKCILAHDTPESYAAAHKGGGCQYVPHEGIALRVVGVHNGKPVVAWTYRGVDHAHLSKPTGDMTADDFRAMMDGGHARRTAHYCGRV